jgi:hypothetical protein
MFYPAAAFNQNIGGWNTASVSSMQSKSTRVVLVCPVLFVWFCRTMRERLSAEAAVQSNRMISAAEERVRKLVGATMTVLSLLSFYVHQDLAYLGAR